ncbi:MAG: replicative DNA helicase [Bacteroidia bacterium]|nr:replicative DNA helicase [Bacteroidia bacterium]
MNEGPFPVAPTGAVSQRPKRRYQAPLLEMGKLPPQALDLEQAVLGALMLDKDALPKVIDIVRPEIFYKEAHKLLFEAIFQLYQESEPVDILTVTHQLRQNGTLDQIGGPAYVTELTGKVASAANIEYHSRIIIQKYLQRELIRISGETMRDAYEDTTDVLDLLDHTEQELFALSESNLKRDTQSAGELVPLTIRKIEEIKAKGDEVNGVSSGFRSLDKLTNGWQSSDLVILAARPGMGKTAFTLSIARNAAVQRGVPVAFFSLEMAAHQIAQRLLSAECELELQDLRTGKLSPDQWRQLNERSGPLAKAPLFINDTPALSIYDLRAKCRRLKSEKGIQLVIVDYLQLMTGHRSKSGTREQEISSISRGLKELAKELDLAVIALSQLSRQVEQRGTDKRPQLSDLRESGAIEQDADVVGFIYRPEYYGLETDEEGNSTRGLAEILIEKQRNGPTGVAKLSFVGQYAKFVDTEYDAQPMPIRFSPGSGFDAPEATIPPASGPLPPTRKFSSSMNDEGDDSFSGAFDLPPF